MFSVFITNCSPLAVSRENSGRAALRYGAFEFFELFEFYPRFLHVFPSASFGAFGVFEAAEGDLSSCAVCQLSVVRCRVRSNVGDTLIYACETTDHEQLTTDH